MEFLGPPLFPWIKIKGVSLNVVARVIFRLIGNCIGRTVEVDEKTSGKESLKEGRRKVIVDR